MINIAVVGASGAIGSAFVRYYAAQQDHQVFALSRSVVGFDLPKVTSLNIDFDDETSVAQAAAFSSQQTLLDGAVVATGLLHEDKLQPEKSLADLSPENLLRLYKDNAIGPALVMKHFLPKMHKDRPIFFAALSARVGSISDNRLGGWYAYRASKAALNMLIKNASIEMTRQNKDSLVVGLHPGTVDSSLSRPFQTRVKLGSLFTPDYAVSCMTTVLATLKPSDTGKLFAYDGLEIQP